MTCAAIALRVNGRLHELAVPHAAPLLQVLRNDLGLIGPKFGCGLGECGACLVLVDGVAARSCCLPVAGVGDRMVTTLEGLATMGGSTNAVSVDRGDGATASADAASAGLHPVQQAFIDCQAAQCGYCLNGMVVATVALLRQHPHPSDAQVRAALSHNLCRCGTHLEILAAVHRAVQLLAP